LIEGEGQAEEIPKGSQAPAIQQFFPFTENGTELPGRNGPKKEGKGNRLRPRGTIEGPGVPKWGKKVKEGVGTASFPN